MPNWCVNQVFVSGPKSEVKKVLKLVEQAKKDEDRLFNQILPMPAHIENTVSGSNSPDYNEKGEPITWYSWSRKFWGTKWDACELGSNLRDDNCLIIGFETAWTPSLPVIHALSVLFPKVNIIHRYYELGQCFVGTAHFKGGEVLKDEIHEANQKSMAYHGLETNYFEAIQDDTGATEIWFKSTFPKELEGV